MRGKNILEKPRAGKMAEWAKVLATKPDDLCFILRTCENMNSSALSPSHPCLGTRARQHPYPNKEINIKKERAAAIVGQVVRRSTLQTRTTVLSESD